MREYIQEQVENTTRHFRFGNIPVKQNDPTPSSINLKAIFKVIEKNLPPHYFEGIRGVHIGHLEEFSERDVNAVYRDNKFFITNRQDSTQDLMNDIVHEFAHHLETLYPEDIYADTELIREFERKRAELKFELQSEGFWVSDFNFKNLKYDEKFDVFLYKRVGRQWLSSLTQGIFIRPYAAISLREYFATGFEAYYLGQQETLQKVSPVLYNKITYLHNHPEH
jgi:hypothetical protein